MKYYFLLISILFCILAKAQAPAPAYTLDLDRGNAAFAAKDSTAAGFYKKAFTKIKDEELKQKTLFNIAESYRRSNNYKQAIKMVRRNY
jgi:hypothetical protein